MPFNRDQYPDDWEEISKAIRERAQNRCENCGAPNGVEIVRLGMTKEQWRLFDPQHDEPNRRSLGPRIVRVVLTVAHLDHDPDNCDPSNLMALCQRCHLRLDAFQHAFNAAVTRRRKRILTGQLELREVKP